MPGIKEVAGIWDRNEQSLLTPLPQDSVHQTEETKHHSNENSENHTPNNIPQIKQPVEVLHTRSVHTHAQYTHTLSSQYTHACSVRTHAQYTHTCSVRTHAPYTYTQYPSCRERSLTHQIIAQSMDVTDRSLHVRKTNWNARSRSPNLN